MPTKTHAKAKRSVKREKTGALLVKREGRDSVRHEVKREGRTARAGRGSTRSARAKTDDILPEHAVRKQQFRTMVKRAGTKAPAGARLIDFRPAGARVRAHAKTLVAMARQCHSRNGKAAS